MTINQFLNLSPKEIAKMNEEERRNIVDDISKKANKRLERLSKLEFPSPAFQNRAIYEGDSILREDGQFAYKPFQSTGKNNNQLANEMKFLRLFLESDTSTVTGAKNQVKRLYKNLLGKSASYNRIANEISYEQSKTFWDAYNKVLQTNAGIISQRDGVTPGYITSGQVQEMIYKIQANNPQMTPEEIEFASRKFMREVYEENVGKPRVSREYTTGKSRKRSKS